MSYVMNVIKLFGGKNAHIIYKLKFIFYMWQKSPHFFKILNDIHDINDILRLDEKRSKENTCFWDFIREPQ